MFSSQIKNDVKKRDEDKKGDVQLSDFPSNRFVSSSAALGVNDDKDFFPSFEKIFTFHFRPVLSRTDGHKVDQRAARQAAILQLSENCYLLGMKGGILLINTEIKESAVKVIHKRYQVFRERNAKGGVDVEENIQYCWSLMSVDAKTFVAGVDDYDFDSKNRYKLLVFNYSDLNAIQHIDTISDAPASCLHKTKEGDFIAGGHKINCYGRNDYKLLWSIADEAHCMDVVQDEKKSLLLVGKNDDKCIRIYDLVSQQKIKEIKIHETNINQVVYLGGDLIATGGGGFVYSTDNDVVVTNIVSGAEQYRLMGHTSRINSLVLFKNKYLISSSKDNQIKVWDIHQRTCVKSMVQEDCPYIYLSDNNWLLVRYIEEVGCCHGRVSFRSLSSVIDQTYLNLDYIFSLSLPLSTLERDILETMIEKMKQQSSVPVNRIQTIEEILSSSSQIKKVIMDDKDEKEFPGKNLQLSSFLTLDQRMYLYFENPLGLNELVDFLPNVSSSAWGLILLYILPHSFEEERALAQIPSQLPQVKNYAGSLEEELTRYVDGFGWRHHKPAARSLVTMCGLFTVSKFSLKTKLIEEEKRLQDIKANVNGDYYKIIKKYMNVLSGVQEEADNSNTTCIKLFG